MKQSIIIKNMVCQRCIEAVRDIFEEIGVLEIEIQLGKVTTESKILPDQKMRLKDMLLGKGFELLDEKQAELINTIKSIIIQEIHYMKEQSLVNFSELISRRLHFDYAYLSRLFSSVEGRTIEKFIMAQKIEKVKELLTYQEKTLSEIAFEMQYSSAAHLSSQFKKITGMTPSEFKKHQKKDRHFLDKI